MEISPQRIIVADDHPIFRNGIADVLKKVSSNIDVAQAGTYDEFLIEARKGEAPGLFVLDLHFPGMDIVKAIPALREEFKITSIVIISMADDRDSTALILSCGVDGFISKAASLDQIRDGLIEVLNGDFVDISTASGLVAHQSSSMFDDLSKRQKEVLRQLCEGHPDKEIARNLNISHHTVRVHISDIYKILKVNTNTAAVALAAKYGI